MDKIETVQATEAHKKFSTDEGIPVVAPSTTVKLSEMPITVQSATVHDERSEVIISPAVLIPSAIGFLIKSETDNAVQSFEIVTAADEFVKKSEVLLATTAHEESQKTSQHEAEVPMDVDDEILSVDLPAQELLMVEKNETQRPTEPNVDVTSVVPLPAAITIDMIPTHEDDKQHESTPVVVHNSHMFNTHELSEAEDEPQLMIDESKNPPRESGANEVDNVIQKLNASGNQLSYDDLDDLFDGLVPDQNHVTANAPEIIDPIEMQLMALEGCPDYQIRVKIPNTEIIDPAGEPAEQLS